MKQKVGQLRHGTDILHVIVPVTNPVRFESRYRLFNKFQEHMLANENVNLIVVEAAFGDRQHEVTKSGNANHIQLRTYDEIWHKENLINIGISRLPEDWQYVAWIDADVQFIHPHWATETLHQLQHYQIVQMFQQAIDLGPDGETLQIHDGFAHLWCTGAPNVPTFGSAPYSREIYSPELRGGPIPYHAWHPGYAWAARRSAINSMGGLLDWAILGAGDHHMALAWIGQILINIPDSYQQVGEAYIRKLLVYQEHCEKNIKRNIGYVPGTIYHNWHGKKRTRYYNSRWKILVDHKFDPDKHLKKDHQGLYQLDADQIGLRDDIRRYFRSRLEDSVDVE